MGITRGAALATIDPAVADSVLLPIEMMQPYGWPNRSNWMTTWTRTARGLMSSIAIRNVFPDKIRNESIANVKFIASLRA